MAEGELIKVPYIQRIPRPDGPAYLYFRKGGHREGPLDCADNSPELLAAVTAILKRLERAKAASTPRPGTVGGMLEAYRTSADFISLSAATQANYDDYVDEMIADIGDVRGEEVTRSFVIALRDAWAARGHRAANLRLQVLKNALAPATEDETDARIAGDPFHKVRGVRRPHDAGEANPIWEDAEVEAAIALAIQRDKPGLARAIALGRWGGYRRGSICIIPRSARTKAVDDAGRPQARHYWITPKRKVLADKREDPRLTALLEGTANKALTVAYNAKGEPWKPRQLNQAIGRLMTALAKQGRARAALDADGATICPLTIHGLRHSRGVELAMAGASDAEIMSQLEHATERAAKIYRRQADRRRMADSAQDRVDNVIQLRKKNAAARAKA